MSAYALLVVIVVLLLVRAYREGVRLEESIAALEDEADR